MDASQLIQNEIARVLSANDIYQTYRPIWRYLLESYMGGEEYRRGGHLIRYQTEANGEYESRLRSTPLDNHCSSVVSVYTSFLFRQPPYRDLGTLTNQPTIEDFLKDCDYEGRSLDHFMKDLSIWVSVFGHAWMIVSKPNTGAVTLADEIQSGARPYVSMLTPLVVTDWSWSRSDNGRYELDYLKYIEDINGDIHTVKEWRPTEIRTSVVDSGKGEYREPPTVEPNGLGYIPAVLCYNKRSSVRGIGISDIVDIADQQRFIYNAKSEAQQSIMLNTHPSLVKTPNTQAGIGAGSVIHMDESMDPGLKPYLLEFNGASIESIYSSIDQAVDNIDKMANTGAVRSSESRSMSGVAMETEFQMLNSRLSDKSNSIELAEENLWKIYCDYQNTQWTGTVTYADSFNVRDNIHDLELYGLAMTMNVPSETFKRNIWKAVADVVVDDNDVFNTIKAEIDSAATGSFSMDTDVEMEMEMDDEFEPHIMYFAATGEMVIAKTPEEHEQLAAEGWVHI